MAHIDEIVVKKLIKHWQSKADMKDDMRSSSDLYYWHSVELCGTVLRHEYDAEVGPVKCSCCGFERNLI